MQARLKRIGLGLVALAIASVVWLPCVHWFFQKPVAEFRAASGISPMATALAARHLKLWTDPALREVELRRMRGSNAEWDFMGRSFLVWSLVNVGLRDPSQKAVCLATMDRIIDKTLKIEREQGMYHFLMGYAKASPYVVQPARSLFVDGEIALMLAARRTLEEKEEFKPLLAERLKWISDGLAERHVLESYPNECWTFDHAVALAALRLADNLNGTDHSAVIRDWLGFAKQHLVHRETGLLVSSFTTDGTPLDGPEGSSLWLVAHCLQVLDPEFARDQYGRARRELGQNHCGFGSAREWPMSWHGPADIDSGPIIPGLNISAGSSGLALVGAASFGDDAYLDSLVATLDFAAFPERSAGELRYCASNQVGDAVMLYAAVLGPLWEKVEAGRPTAGLTQRTQRTQR
jgi:hypothetical protein